MWSARLPLAFSHLKSGFLTQSTSTCVEVTAQLSKASGQYNNGVISFLLHGEDGSNLQATRVVEDTVHHHNVSSSEVLPRGSPRLLF